MTLDPILLHCPTCARDCVAEAPPCPDGHGSECPDRACVECGTALLVDAALFASIYGPPIYGAARRAA